MSFTLICFRLIQALWVDATSVSLHQQASSNHAWPLEQLRKHNEKNASLSELMLVLVVQAKTGVGGYKPTSSGISRLSFCRG